MITLSDLEKIITQNKDKVVLTPEQSAKQAETTKFRLMDGSGLQWLAEKASSRSMIVNVGAWTGSSVRALANATRGAVIAIDPWSITPEESRSWKGTFGSEWDENDPEFLYKTYLESVVTLTNVVSIKGWSLNVAKQLKGFKFDMVFIDANHFYDPVKADIITWRGLINTGGLLCGHDYREQEPGVRKAVDELVPDRKLGPDTIWFTVI